MSHAADAVNEMVRWSDAGGLIWMMVGGPEEAHPPVIRMSCRLLTSPDRDRWLVTVGSGLDLAVIGDLRIADDEHEQRVDWEDDETVFLQLGSVVVGLKRGSHESEVR